MADDEQAQRTLEAARRGLGPSAADESRVRAGLLPVFSAPEGALNGAEQAQGVGMLGGALGRLLIVSAIAAGFGTGGYFLGKRAGFAEASTAAPGAPLPAATAAPAQGPPPQELASELLGPAASVLRRAPALAPRPSASAAADALDEEVRALRRIERALRARNPQLALALLQELDRAVPAAKLVEERRAAFTVASCEVGFGASRKSLLDAFVAQYPASIYVTRVQGSCADEESDRPATDSRSSQDSSP